MSESDQGSEYVNGINYDIITINLNTRGIVRNAVLITAAAVLTKGTIDVAGHLIKPRLARLAKRFQARAIEEAHKKDDAEVSEQDENQQ